MAKKRDLSIYAVLAFIRDTEYSTRKKFMKIVDDQHCESNFRTSLQRNAHMPQENIVYKLFYDLDKQIMISDIIFLQMLIFCFTCSITVRLN